MNRACNIIYLKNGSHYRASELIPCIFLGWSFQKHNRKEEEKETEQQQQTYQFT